MSKYVPHSEAEREQMLKAVGVKTLDELYSVVPKSMLIKELDIESQKSEMEVFESMTEIANKNFTYDYILRGAGAYDHYIPAIVKQITSKEEFVTAYTPYQAEISQGILQSIFEYQTMICELTGMNVSNASVYDGATAAAEGVNACVDKKRRKVLVLASSKPQNQQVIKTYCFGQNVEVEEIPCKNGLADLDVLKERMSEEIACVYAEQPNFFGNIEDMEKISAIAKEKKAKFIMYVNPISAVVLKTPFECGADIAVGEGQPLGLPLAFGGPYLGFMASTTEMMRKLPGRIVGETRDKDGERAFVLTLQAREQHIKRERASSNICSNQALCAMTSAVYLSALGEKGLRKVAENSYKNAHYAIQELTKINGFEKAFDAPFFHEFTLKTKNSTDEINNLLKKHKILGGLKLGENESLWCFTEKYGKEKIDRIVKILKEELK